MNVCFQQLSMMVGLLWSWGGGLEERARDLIQANRIMKKEIYPILQRYTISSG